MAKKQSSGFRCPECRKEIKDPEIEETTCKFKALDGKKHKFLKVICPKCQQPIIKVKE